MGHKWACPWGYMWYIGLYRENIKKSSCLKPQGIELWYLVCSITKTSGPLPSLFKLWSRSTKFVQIMTLGPKMVLSQGATCFTQAYGKHEKIFLYETTNHRALIFDMKTSTNFVQVILLGPKMFPPQWSHDLLFYIGFNKENLKKSSCLKLQGLEPWYLVCSITSHYVIGL